MTLPDLHPDELLRRASQDRITPAERADLGAHLQRCAACALEHAVRGDLAASAISSEADHAIAARVVERVLSASAPLKIPQAAGRWPRRLARAAVIAVMLMSTAVGASVLAVRLHDRRAAAVAPVRVPAPPVVATTRRAPRARGPAPAEAPVPTAPPAEMPLPVPSPADEPIGHPRARPVVAAAPLPPPAALQPPALGGTAPSPDAPSAAVVLGRAEEARAARRFGDALHLYDDLAARFPGSREEIVARVLHGQLLLDERHDAPAALRWFDRYLGSAPDGSLAEEARLGRAQALQALGWRDEERAAWEQLLGKHPASVHAPAARARLGTLRAP
jgi:hypothetical protein